MPSEVQINPHVLKWMREEAGLSLDQAAARFGLRDTKKRKAAEKLKAWEEGSDLPTMNQARKVAKALHRPLVVLFLRRPPRKAPATPDFRSTRTSSTAEMSEELATLVRQAYARQLELRALVLDEEEHSELAFVGRYSRNSHPETLAQNAREIIGLPIEVQAGLRSKEALFAAVRSAIEATGVFVQLQGNLGSFHTRIDTDEFRGLAIADSIAPLIVLNPNDAKGALTFSLVHEFAHLMINESGISNLSPFDDGSENAVEAFCNAVAGEFIFPHDEFNRKWQSVRQRPIRTAVDMLARQFSSSHTAAAHRLWKKGEINDQTWWKLRREYLKFWEQHQAREREKRKKSETGPSYFQIKRYHLGAATIELVASAVASGDLSSTRASRILGVSPSGISKLRNR